MQTKIRDQWIDALRSGEFKQGFCYLKNNKDEYSALGVLAELAVRKKVGHWVRPASLLCFSPEIDKYPYRFELLQGVSSARDNSHSTFFLPIKLLASIGLTFSDAIYVLQMNDKSMSFVDIASEIADDFGHSKIIHLNQPAAQAVS
jgi:hypothetical protein